MVAIAEKPTPSASSLERATKNARMKRSGRGRPDRDSPLPSRAESDTSALSQSASPEPGVDVESPAEATLLEAPAAVGTALGATLSLAPVDAAATSPTVPAEDALPAAAALEFDTAMSAAGEYVFFWRQAGPYGQFCQWFHSPFVADGVTFATAEQYMMYKKAELFGDFETASAIANSPSLHPMQHKKMGRSVRRFDAKTWSERNVRIVARGNYYKFMQNDALKSVLMSTGAKTLVEASPHDRVWGIGFDSATAMANVGLWGENRLGRALMMVRDEIASLLERSG
ncbi:MAG: hypothetical protein M1826_002032 [Phylliscum demangeonii]|nr:MAG: hypothetical protein M1826_002032 [Phylliscum demangeonii]